MDEDRFFFTSSADANEQQLSVSAALRLLHVDSDPEPSSDEYALLFWFTGFKTRTEGKLQSFHQSVVAQILRPKRDAS